MRKFSSEPFFIFIILLIAGILTYLLIHGVFRKGLIFRPFFRAKKPLVVGFLPYWNLTPELDIDFNIVDQLIYFSLMVDENGEILKTDWAGHGEGGWLNLSNPELKNWLDLARKNRKKVLLCIASFDAEAMFQITADAEKSTYLIDQILELVNDYQFDGVDIDFEYFAQIGHEGFGENFNIFLTTLKSRLYKQNPELILSVDIYPKAFIENEPYDLERMVEIVDQIIIMAYDYTQSGSNRAGPIAPINTPPDLGIRDNYSIIQTLLSFENKIDGQKIILGIPLYGYQWRTYDLEHRSLTWPGLGDTVQYKDLEEVLQKDQWQENWDSITQTPWASLEKNGAYWQIHYDNLESYERKFELVQQYKIKGLGFWALGYEGNRREIWDLLDKNF